MTVAWPYSMADGKIFSQVQFVYPMKYRFFTTGYTVRYGLLVAFVGCWAVCRRGLGD